MSKDFTQISASFDTAELVHQPHPQLAMTRSTQKTNIRNATP